MLSLYLFLDLPPLSIRELRIEYSNARVYSDGNIFRHLQHY